MIEAILKLIYKIFGVTKSIKKNIEQDNTISSAGEYMKEEDEVQTIEKSVEKETSSEIKKVSQTISF